MNLKFHNKKITGILTVLPENEVNFDDEIDNYDCSRGQSMKLKLIMGYGKKGGQKRYYSVGSIRFWHELSF